ncbi:MAG: nucleoside-diphosphate kinase [Novosphingobium sp. 12-64-8]|nr:MAG: nucleoside-diphosphate kinase [Novosphingobium sp. 12-64-8]
MSVAFRRESDEEHLEPKFELPIPAGPNLVTAAGLAQIAARVDEIEAGLPALTDDDAKKAARRDLKYWRQRLATAELVPVPKGDKVEFGCRVRFVLAGKEREITIVGHDEADAAAGRVAFTAPLARTMIGAEAGDFADFNGKDEAIEVLEISAPV